MNKLISRIRQKIRAMPYFRANGDKTLRLNYDLNKGSIVFDVGGYVGDWTNDIYDKYGCQIHVFEPVPAFANKIKKRFADNKNIAVHQFGLSKNNSTERIHLDQNSSSIYKKDGDEIDMSLVKLGDFFSQNNIDHVDLMKINIEGGEYDLLEELIQSGLVKKVTNIQVQFHDFVPNAKKRMEKIQNLLGRSHKLTYQFKFVWENWLLK